MPSISDFYANQEILITGGSGFIGKVLIEKILRSLPAVSKIYILLRERRGKSPEQRFKEILELPLFERARVEQPEAFKKCIAISGDLSKVGLALSAEDNAKLQNVTIILHSAANVKFTERFQNIALLNIRGTYELLKIAENLKKLKVFSYVSTAYSNPDRGVVNEEIYPAYYDWRMAIKLAESLDDETLDVLFPKFSLKLPNTYVFTKNVTESMVNEYRNKFAIVIYRPSVVISCVSEPIPGYIDNLNGPFGLLVGCCLGIMRTSILDDSFYLDWIGVDVTVKGLLLAVYKTVKDTQTLENLNANEVRVFNSTQSDLNLLTMSGFIDYGRKVVPANPVESFLWVPGGSPTKYAIWHYLRFFGIQMTLSILGDAMLLLTKQEPVFVKNQRRIVHATNFLSIYMKTKWTFSNTKFLDLEKLIPDNEREKFAFIEDIKFDHEEFIRNCWASAKRFLLNESSQATKAAQRRFKIFSTIDRTIKVLFVMLILYILLRYLKYF